jgi:hypothetical protein
MDPNKPDYDFILNSGKTTKKSPFPMPSGNSQTQRILIVVGGAVLLLIVGLMLFNLILGGGGSASEKVAQITIDQQEIVRIAERGTKDAVGTDTKAYAQTVKLSVETQQKKLLEALSKQGKKMDSKLLATGKNTDNDKALDSAAQSNRFDEALMKYMRETLAEYQQDLKEAYDQSGNKNTKAALSTAYDDATILLKTQ